VTTLVVLFLIVVVGPGFVSVVVDVSVVVFGGAVTVVDTVVVVVSVVVVSVVWATAVPVHPASDPATSAIVHAAASLRTGFTTRALHPRTAGATRRTCMTPGSVHHRFDPASGRAGPCLQEFETAAMTTEIADTRSGWAALFRDAFNQSRNAMVLLDDDRRHVEVNGAYVQLLGYRPSDLIGRPVYELRADHSAMSEKQWHAALRQRQFTGAIDLLRADGAQVTVEYAGHPEIVTGRQLVLFVALRAARGVRRRDDGPAATVRADLSQREIEVVKLLADGYSGPEVAEELRIAHNTVRTHTRNAMTKMSARSRAQLVAKALAECAYW